MSEYLLVTMNVPVIINELMVDGAEEDQGRQAATDTKKEQLNFCFFSVSLIEDFQHDLCEFFSNLNFLLKLIILALLNHGPESNKYE